MSIAVFAGKSFQTSGRKINTFNSFSTGSGLQTEKQDVEGKKPSTYIKGADLGTMSFVVPLKASLGMNVRNEYESWKALAETGKAYPFILGGKAFGANKWLLKSAQLSNVAMGTKEMIEAMLQLDFEEYVRPGSAKSSSSATTKSVNVVDQILTETEKSEQKRDNPNVNLSILNMIGIP